jgi:glycolate oxidase iron-sulfur subunit
MDSPRGRIYLMRAVTDGRLPLDEEVRHHLDLCLDCRACESACPSGVQYGKLIEPFRIGMQNRDRLAHRQRSAILPWWQRLILFHVFPYVHRARWAVWPVRIMQALGIDWLMRKTGVLRLLPERMRQMHEMLPKLPLRREPLPELLPAEGRRRARVALLTGCVNDALFHETNWATARVLQANGCEVWIPEDQVCCGALHFHSGVEQPAIGFATKNCDVFLREPVDAIITNVAGCGCMMKDYDHLLAGTASAGAAGRFKSKVKDISEFLMELGPIAPKHPLKLRATYHDACHLCHGQQIRKQPRDLLAIIPGLELVPLPETEICCGAAGSYNLTQPEMAARLGERKATHIRATKPQAVFTANAGCLLQIAKHLRATAPDVWVAHPIEALWRSYTGVG